MSGRRGVIIGGSVVGAGALYYLYNAGGNPKVAERQFEHDAARLSSSVKHDLPGKGKELKTQAELYGKEAGAKLDSAFSKARAEADKFDNKVYEVADDVKQRFQQGKASAQQNLNSMANDFDRTASRTAKDAESAARGYKDQALEKVKQGASALESEADKKQSKGWFGFGGK